MDCQFIMGFFTFVYYQSFIAEHKASVGGILEMAIQGLAVEDQIEVLRGLVKYLVMKGELSEKVGECLADPGGLMRR